MIGVLARNAERDVVREFFELFKTHWEFYRDDREYDVVICSGRRPPENSAKLVLIYGGERGEFDRARGLENAAAPRGAVLAYKSARIPLAGNCLTFNSASHALAEESTRKAAAREIEIGGQKFIRVGFDLFHEIRTLLTRGQPESNATIPALELHIALLRDLILSQAIPLVEIPPIPEGGNFIVCLTHDVDHVGIRNHWFDHTMMGFLYRATVGSLKEVMRGRKTVGQMLKNWGAVLSLPFVHLGLVKDFWYQFDHYLELEKGLPSTFFVIPKKGEPGVAADGTIPEIRAAKYDAKELREHLQRVTNAGNEVGVHGIDAWRSSDAGAEESKVISDLIGRQELGVRMHWLFFDENSPAVLEAAQFSYDSTSGYNTAIGYRAGTTQVFKPFNTGRLLELPLHVMDTAMFYPPYMNLSPAQARKQVDALVDNAVKFGGVLTINWHDRSIAPERLWDGFYVELLEHLKKRGARFLTANQTVAWFRKRRAVAIEDVTWVDGEARVKASMKCADDNLPGMRIRVRKTSAFEPHLVGGFSDLRFEPGQPVEVLPVEKSASHENVTCQA